MNYDISVIVLNYNAAKEAILRTIKSIIYQKNCRYEIIFADDGSNIDNTKEIQMLCEKYNYKDFFIIKDRNHLGTVKNILRALPYVKGKYVKLIGCGDLLFSPDVLSNVINFMDKKNSICTFVDIQAFCVIKNNVIKKYYRTPINRHHYKTGNKNNIQKDIVYLNDYILGAAIFYEINALKKYLKELSDTVVYFEDWIQVLFILNNYSIDYLPIPGILYEMGSGISTSHSNTGNSHFLKDEKNFWQYLEENYNCKYVRARNTYRKKEKSSKSGNIKRIIFLAKKYLSNPYYRICKFFRWKKFTNKNYDLGFFLTSEFNLFTESKKE